jgi:PKD repeat protein
MLNGGRFQEQICIEKTPKPRPFFHIAPTLDDEANYDAGIIYVCKDETVYFQNFSKTEGGSALIAHEWRIDGPTGTDYLYDFEPSYVFTESGLYSVTLTVTNECNCSEQIEILFEVLETGLQIQCNSLVCENGVETYTIGFAPSDEYPDPDELHCEDYRWIVDGGTIISQNGKSVSVQWDNVDENGFGYLTFIPEGCDVPCNKPVTIKVPVIKDNIKIDGPDEICQGQQVRYSIPRWPTTEVEWQIQGSGAVLIPSDQNNEIILEAHTPGNYILTATYTNTLLGCGGTATKEINIIPSVAIQGHSSRCVDDFGTYNLSNNGFANWRVNGPQGFHHTFSGNHLNVQFPHPGTYAISAEGGFCIDNAFIVRVNSVPDAPQSIDGSDEFCLGTPISFSVPNIPPPGTNTYWEVDNGTIINGNPGQEISVSFSANPTGPYKVRARNRTGQCFSPWVEKTVVPIEVDFQISGATVACSSTYEIYSVNETEGDKYTWTISPDYLGSVVNYPQEDEVEILWNNVSAPTVATIIVDVEKCQQVYTETYQVTVQQAPDITITAPTTVCRDAPVTFGIQTPGGLNSYSSIVWDFGDGNTNTSNNPSPTHTYDALSTGQLNYVVTVTVTNPNGCLGTSTASFSINVIPAPVALITPQTGGAYCDLSDLLAAAPTFNLVIDTNYPTATQINWFDDLTGLPADQYYNSATGEFIPQDFGNYYAVIVGDNGCVTESNILSIIEDQCGSLPPDVSCYFSGEITDVTPQLTACGTVDVTASYTGTPIDFKWISVGGTFLSSNINSAQIEYSIPGTYTIKYKVTYAGIDDNGDYCEVILTKTEQIVVPYIAGVGYTVSCSSTPGMYDLTIYDTSSYVTGTPVPTPTFFLNNVNVGTGSGPITVQVNPGMQHTIRVDIIDTTTPGSFVCSKQLIIDLLPFPEATIVAPTEACMGTPVPFSAQVNDPNLTYLWDFDDQAFNSLPDPVRVFSAADTYNVTLTITNIYGCSVVVTHPIDIEGNDMEGTITLTPQTDCFGETITLTYDDSTGGINLPVMYYWYFKGNLVATNTTGIFQATQPGEYALDVENSAGCLVERVTSVFVEFLDTPTANISGPYEVCSGSLFTLESTRKNDDYSYAWTRNSQNLPQFNNQQIITTQENAPGTYIYGLEITAPSGCIDTAQFTVTVNPTPAAPRVDFKVLDCAQYTVHLSASADESGTFIWSDGQSGSDIFVHKGGPYRVTFINDYGCRNSTEIDVPFNPNAYIWVHPTGCYTVCEETAANPYLTGPNLPFEYWEWRLDTNPINSGHGFVAPQSYAGDGNYTLILDNGYCRVESESMEWVLNPNCRRCRMEEIRVEDMRSEVDRYGNCYYIINVYVYNPYPDLSYTLQETSGNGTIVPGGGLLFNGPNLLQLEFYPNAAFTGGTIDLLLVADSWNDEEPYKCLIEFSVNLPPCGSMKQATSSMDLTVSPNPSTGVSILKYSGLPLDPSTGYSLELYDISGRLFFQKMLHNSTGEWQLDMNNFANGVYLAVLRKEGEVQGYKRIILRK